MNYTKYYALPIVLILAGAGCTNTMSQVQPRGMSMRQIAEKDALREHCRMMPQMSVCEQFKNDPFASFISFNRSIAGLSEAKAQTTETIQNQATFELNTALVKKTIAGRTIRMLSYNDQIPGPLLRVKQNDAITIKLNNKLDDSTTVHWHGLRLDNLNDGVPYTTQQPVNPGNSYTYRLKFPDAGLYWYHPHIREDYQKELGLYGLIWVEPSDPDAFAPVNSTEFLAIDDILLGDEDAIPFDKDHLNHTLMGRFGNVMMINGKTDYSVTTQKNSIVRFAMANSANTRTFKIGIPGAKMKLVGGDSGGYQNDSWVDAVVLAPSERAIIDVQFTKPGTYKIRHLGPEKQYDLGTVIVQNSPATQDYSLAFKTLKTRPVDFVGLDSYNSAPIDKELDLTIDMPGMMGNMEMNQMMHGSTDGIEWEDSMATMNENSNDQALSWVIKDKATGLTNDKIDYSFKRDQKVKIRIFNAGNSMHPMQHPIHFHGNRFVVLSTNGEKNTNLAWKDTVLVPIGATVDILLDTSNPGDWMAHCHISEHFLEGMMFTYHVK